MGGKQRIGTLALLAVVSAWSALSCSNGPTPIDAVDLPTWVRAADDDATSSEEEHRKGRPSGAMQALDYWGAQRAYPFEKIPDAAYGVAMRQARAMQGRFAGAARSVAPWESMGPANIGGRTLCLALDPDDPDFLYAGSASGGLWKSTTGGVGADAWDLVDTGYPMLGVSTIAIDPGDGNVMYIGTGEAYSYDESIGGEAIRTTRGSYGVGILKSEDGGATWAPSLDWTYEQSRGVWMIQIDPTDSDVVYAATTEGIYKSTDAGDTWNRVHDVIMAMDVRIHPSDPQILFAAHGNLGSAGHGIYRSQNGGQTWTRLTNGLPSTWDGKAGLAVSPTSPDTVFASIANQDAGLGLYRSDDAGDSWTLVNSTDYAQYQGWYSHYVVVSPFDVDDLFTGGIEIWRSKNGGGSLALQSHWQSVYFGTSPPEGPIGDSDYAHADHHFALWHPTDPHTIFFASDGGIFRSTDEGNSFESLIGGYRTTQFYNGFSNSATDVNIAMGGLQDNFVAIYNGTVAWQREIGGDGTWTAQNPVDGSTIYAAVQYLRIYRSDDFGVLWALRQPPTQSGDVTAFAAPYVLGLDDPSVLYAGRSRVYRSNNEGDDWFATNFGNPLSSGNPVLSLAVAPTSVDVAYAGTAPITGRARLFATHQGGLTWTEVTGSLPDRYPSDITVDPNDPDRVLVTFMGFGTSHLFLSADGGSSWSDIGGGLPDIPTSAVEIDPDHPEIIYVGTDLGIYLSLDAGQTWQPFNDGMPLAMVNDLKVFLPARKIRAATHGNGAWQRDMFDPANCAAPGEATDLALSHAGGVGGSTTLAWSAPTLPGDAPVRYDTVSSTEPDDFQSTSPSRCVQSDDFGTTSVDTAEPDPGGVFYYLVRAESVCGQGPVGSDSNGTPRVARVCPAPP